MLVHGFEPVISQEPTILLVGSTALTGSLLNDLNKDKFFIDVAPARFSFWSSHTVKLDRLSCIPVAMTTWTVSRSQGSLNLFMAFGSSVINTNNAI